MKKKDDTYATILKQLRDKGEVNWSAQDYQRYEEARMIVYFGQIIRK